MTVILVTLIVFLCGIILLIIREKKKEKNLLNRHLSNDNSSHNRTVFYHGGIWGICKQAVYDTEALKWCATFLHIGEKELSSFLYNPSEWYNLFWLAKRGGGYRMIAAPKKELKAVHRTIYEKILINREIHPSATGFRRKMSIVENVRPHLGHAQVLKVDIHDFFGSIRKHTVRRAFKQMGYEPGIAKVLAALCCKSGRLPQGAPTSPALSNIIVAGMDEQLAAISRSAGLTYTRYADDLTFSGNLSSHHAFLAEVEKIVTEHKFVLNRKKTRFLDMPHRKIITGVSVSSGTKLTIPKVFRREIRQQVYHVLTKGLAEHQKYIGSSDPAYLKRLTGRLSYWHAVEPDNAYVIRSLKALKELSH